MHRSTHSAFAIFIGLALSLAPAIAAAQAGTQTTQLLPPGGNSCTILPITAITAKVIDGALHSFDVTVGNASYVAVLAQVGGETLPFRYMTRFDHGGGMLRHHVDLDTTATRGSLPVSLTLLSSPPGAPTCLSVISFSVGSNGEILAPGMTSGQMPPVPTKPTKPSTSSGASSGSQGGSTSGGQGTSTVKPTTGTSTASGTPNDGGLVSRLQGLCTGNGALQLWFLLLAIYVVIAALTALARPPLAQKAVWLPIAAILAPLALLLAFWLLAPSCRAAGWIPAMSIIIAVGALLVAFRDQNPAVRIIPLPPAKPSTKTPSVVNKTSTLPAQKTDTKTK